MVHEVSSADTHCRAGVLGLSTALVLAKHKHLNVTVVAKHMPGDYDIEYASPWAGANYFPVGKPGSNLQRFEKATWAELDRICREVPEAGIHYQVTRTFGRTKDAGTATGQWFEELTKEDAWFKDVVPNVRRTHNFHVLIFVVVRLYGLTCIFSYSYPHHKLVQQALD